LPLSWLFPDCLYVSRELFDDSLEPELLDPELLELSEPELFELSEPELLELSESELLELLLS